MALEEGLAQRLWEERYRKHLEAVARKNSYLNEFNDPEDLFQDMAINVWMKAVKAFNVEAVTYTDDPERAFNAFYQTVLQQYLATLAERRQTGKAQYEARGLSLDKPVGGDEGEDGERFIDLLTKTTEDPAEAIDRENMLAELPENLSGPLRHIIENAGRGDFSKALQEVRDQWGWTQRRLFNELVEQPAFTEWAGSL